MWFNEMYFTSCLKTVEVIESVLSVCVSVFMGLRDLRCAPPHEYRTMLCNIDLRCTPPSQILWYGCVGPLGQKDFWAKGLFITRHRRCINVQVFFSVYIVGLVS